MSDPLDHNKNAPDEALIGPGSTATGGGTSHESSDEHEGDGHIRPLDRSGTGSSQLADERFRDPTAEVDGESDAGRLSRP